MKVTILGTGSSAGVPLVGCKCEVCTSNDPKNKRSRVSIHLEAENTSILVDASPDLRQQCLQNGITKADAILITHNHADHTNGLDDARCFNFVKNQGIPIYSSRETLEGLEKRFDYAFTSLTPGYGWYKPLFLPVEIGEGMEPFTVGDIEVRPFWQLHGSIRSLGFRFGDFTYSTDTNFIPEESFRVIEGTRIWLVDCLRPRPAPTHSHLEQTLQWIARIKPELALLTHMNHEMEYNSLCDELPPNIRPAFDGLSFDV